VAFDRQQRHAHYSVAQVRELFDALESIRCEPERGGNKTLRALAEEARELKAKEPTTLTATEFHGSSRREKRA
jgi:hypothetical protein